MDVEGAEYEILEKMMKEKDLFCGEYIHTLALEMHLRNFHTLNRTSNVEYEETLYVEDIIKDVYGNKVSRNYIDKLATREMKSSIKPNSKNAKIPEPRKMTVKKKFKFSEDFMKSTNVDIRTLEGRRRFYKENGYKIRLAKNVFDHIERKERDEICIVRRPTILMDKETDMERKNEETKDVRGFEMNANEILSMNKRPWPCGFAEFKSPFQPVNPSKNSFLDVEILEDIFTGRNNDRGKLKTTKSPADDQFVMR